MTPKLMTDLLTERNIISCKNGMTQLFTTHFFGGIEVFILTGMAYDQYVAIYQPLHYTVIMSRQRCNSILNVLGPVSSYIFFFLPFCSPNEIDHYFCVVYPLLKLACADTHKIGFLVIGLIGLMNFLVLMSSYIMILHNVRAYSSESRHKALSAFSSYITVVILFFVPDIFIYIRPATTLLEDKAFTQFYTIIVPILNPLFYTLRNMEMKNAMVIFSSQLLTLSPSCQC